MTHGTRLQRILATLLLGIALVGCAGDNQDLLRYIDEVKSRPGGRIDPLPPVKPYQTYAYEADRMTRSPFVPDRPTSRGQAEGPRPDQSRPREYLEQFPLDTMTLVGTLTQGGVTYGLLQTQDGLLHRVVPGNFLGQNEGRIVAITEAEITVEELVADGIGGFYRRSAAIGLEQ